MTKTIRYIGLGIPGNVDPINGCTRYLPNFQWTQSVPIGKELSNQLHLPVHMRNDGRCAAVAESRYGAGKNSNIFAMLTLGTGIGGALIINHKLYDGCSFDAGDFGHHVICSGQEAFQCVCGKKGCFEYHASANGLIRHYQRERERMREREREREENSCDPRKEKTDTDDIELDNALIILEKVRGNESIAISALHSYKNDLATGLANLVTFYNPDTIALGGGLAQAEEIFEGLQDLVDTRTLPATRGIVKIVPAVLGVDAGAIGAALLGDV
eukprot:CAMPEP_0182421360 /NCGR_PEP_ID=MMETSP1167-20130531/6712_1 /TAXON_ID=2988 /ORGANISM="Mallomonas Sp, Strain CCMP3275" /LENGTH=270 /DNA_ID=CAMNT_0024598411 /DNA_START=437 /DNA_END=1249 /DNA_ORIENTATION=-